MTLLSPRSSIDNRISWEDRAACKGMDPNIHFFALKPRTNKKGQVALDNRGEPIMVDDDPTPEAIAACAACPVKGECFDWAMYHEQYGYQGGTTAEERQRLRTAWNVMVVPPQTLNYAHTSNARLPTDIDHGTNKGYKQHKRHGQIPCAACFAAHSEQALISEASRHLR